MKKLLLFLCLFTSVGIAGKALAQNNLDNAGLPSTSARGAYSLRKLSSTYTGFAFKARRVSDNAEANIAFDGARTISGTSVATITAAGTSGLTVSSTLDFSSFYSGTDVRVMTWYDQSGNSNDITQTVTASMPKIATAGVINLLNGKPALNFATVSMNIPISSSLLNVQGSIAAVHSQPALQGGYTALLSWQASIGVGFGPLNSAGQFGLYNVNNFNAAPVINTNVAINTTYASNATWTNSNANVTESRNKSASSGSLAYRFTAVTNGTLGNNGGFFVGNVPELIIFSTPLVLADRQALENNQVSSFTSNLSALTTTAGVISPTFSPATTAYTASVPIATASVTVTPTVADATATVQVQVNGGGYSTVTSGNASLALALNVGTNPIHVKVTAQDGTTIKTYTITVRRDVNNLDNAGLATTSARGAYSLRKLSTTYTGFAFKARRVSDNAEANIAFDGSGTISSSSVATITAAGTSGLTVSSTLDFSSFYSGTDVRVMTWYDQSGNSNDITQTVTASMPKIATAGVINLLNGKPALNFATVSMTVPISSSLLNVQGSIAAVHSQPALQGGYTALLSWQASIGVGFGPLNSAGQFGLYNVNNFNAAPVINTNVAINTTYASNATWTNSNANVTESRNKSASSGSLAYRFTAVTNGTLGNNGGFFVGNVPELIIFSAPLVLADRQAMENNQFTNFASANANLSALTTTAGSLTPTFATLTTDYTASVSNATTSITVTPTRSDANATITVNGTAVTSGSASGSIALTVGTNVITTIVTAQNGTTKTYTVTVTRAKADQTITFPALSGKNTTSPDFEPGATTDSGLALTYTSSNTSVATVYQDNTDGDKWKIHIQGEGTTDIVAAQAGNSNYNSASVSRELIVANVLPVELINYQAKIQNNKEVLLSWVTSSELNNAGFEIWKATDGKSFEKLTFIKGAGSSATKQSYSYVDLSPKKGDNYYKLIQLDKDGIAKEVGLKSVRFDITKQDIVSVYPNPTSNLLNVDFEVGLHQTLKIIDLSGKILIKKNISSTQTKAIVSLSDFPAGVYLLQLSGKNGKTVKQVLKQ